MTNFSTERDNLITRKQHKLSLLLLSLHLVLPSSFEISDGTKKQSPLWGTVQYFPVYSDISPLQPLCLEIWDWSSVPLSHVGLDQLLFKAH